MGALLVPIIEAIATDAGITLSATAAEVIADVVLIAAVYGAEKLLAPKSNLGALSANNQLLRNSASPRMLAYGRSSVGGNVVYINQSGSSNQYLDIVFVVAAHEIDAIESVVLDNWALGFDGTGTNGGGTCTQEVDVRTGVVSSRFAGKVFCNLHLGVAGDSADSTLITNSGGQWTSTCKLSGCAYVYMRLTWDSNTFSAGIPNVYCVIRGKKVLDPRTAVYPTGTVNGSGDLVVSSTSGISAGMRVIGPGYPNNTVVSSISGSTLITNNTGQPGRTGLYAIGTPAWSQNAAMALYDYMMDQTYGFRAQPGDFDSGYLQTACNDCDTTISLASSGLSSLVAGNPVLGPGIPIGTTVSSVSGTNVTISANATATLSGFQVNFGNVLNWCSITSGSNVVACPQQEAAYTVNGIVDTSRTPGEIRNDMLGAMAGACPWVGGKWYMKAGTYQTPTITLTDTDLRAPPTLQTKVSRRDAINSVKGTYIEPGAQYNPTDATPYQNSSHITLDDDVVLWQDIQLPFTTSAATAQRLFKIIEERSRAGQVVLTLPCKLTALSCQCNDNIMVTLTRFGFSSAVFEVIGFTLANYEDENHVPCLGIDLVLKATNSGVWAWTGGSEDPFDLVPLSNLPSPYNVTAPGSLTCTSDVTTLYTQPDGTLVPRLKLVWPASTDDFVLNGGKVEIQYKNHSDSNWLDWGSDLGTQTTEYIGNVLAGNSVDARVRFRNSAGYTSAWTETDSTTISLGTGAPGTPGTPVATAGQGKVINVQWPASTDSTIKYAKVYRATSSGGTYSFLGSSQGGIAQANSYDDFTCTLGQQYFYKVSYVNTNNVEGSESSASNGATATQASLKNPNAPSTPTTPTTGSTSATTYTAGDGTVYAKVYLNIAGLPSGAVVQSVEFQVSGDTYWSGQTNEITNSSTFNNYEMPQLAPNTTYLFRVAAFNESGLETDSATLSVTTPNKSAAPTAPSNVVVSGPNQNTPVPSPVSGVLQSAANVTFTGVSDPDLAGYQWIGTSTYGSPPSNSLALTSILVNNLPAGPGPQLFSVYSSGLLSIFIWVRSFNTSGLASNWVGVNTNFTSVCSTGFGSMSLQPQVGSKVAQVQLGTISASSVRVTTTDDWDTIVYETGGGDAKYISGAGTSDEKWSIDLTNKGFTAKPTAGWIQLNSTHVATLECYWDYDDAGNNSTTAIVHVYDILGTTLAGSTPYRFAYKFRS